MSLVIIRVTEALGGRVSYVVLTRILVTDIQEWKEVRAVCDGFFDEFRPMLAMIEVSRLIDDAAVTEAVAIGCAGNRKHNDQMAVRRRSSAKAGSHASSGRGSIPAAIG